MGRILAFARPVLAAVLVIVAAGCSSGGSGGSGSSGVGTGLETALARVSDTTNNKTSISYDDTSELVSLTGKSLSAEEKGYGQLRGTGDSNLLSAVEAQPNGSGINLFNQSYAITVGDPAASLTLVAGGQNAAQVAAALTKLGWKKDADGTLTGPGIFAASTAAAPYALFLNKVKPINGDVVFGASGADLSQIGSPSGPTLAGDSVLKAVAGCLGNVVAASIYGGTGTDITATPAPTEIAVGISQPASATATPHAVVCVSWPTQAAASTYAATVTKTLASGFDPQLNERYSALFKGATVTNVGGDAHVVQWEGDTSDVETVFNLQNLAVLPGLVNCSKITPAQKAQVIGCI